MTFARNLCLTGLFVLGMIASPFTQQAVTVAADEAKPVITVTTGPLQGVLDSAEGIAKQLGQEAAVKMLRDSLAGLEGIDQSKSIAVAALSTGDEFVPVVILPINSVEKMIVPLALLAQLQVEPLEKGRYQIDSPIGPIIVVEKNGWAIAAMQSQIDLVPSDPAKILLGLEKEATLGIRIDFANTSQEEVMTLLAPLQMLAMMNPDPQIQQSMAMLDSSLSLYFDNFTQLKETFNIDAKTGDVRVVANYYYNSEGDLAKMLVANKDAKSNFAGFFQPKDTVASFIVAAEVATKNETLENLKTTIKDMYDPMIQGMLAQLEENDDDASAYMIPTVKTVYDQYMALLDGGKSDIAMTLFPNLSFVAATSVPDGKKFDALVDELTKTAKENDAEKLAKLNLKRNFETAEGFRLTSLSAKIENAPGFEGKSASLVFGISDKALCVAAGVGTAQEMTDLLKKSLAASKTPVAVPQPSMLVSMKQIGVLLQNSKLVNLAKAEQFQAVVDALIASGDDATVTGSLVFDKTMYGMDVTMSGKIWPVVKLLIEQGQQIQQVIRQRDVE